VETSRWLSSGKLVAPKEDNIHITGRNPSRVPLAPPAAALPLTDFPGYATE
jgi:hypothetical protein